MKEFKRTASEEKRTLITLNLSNVTVNIRFLLWTTLRGSSDRVVQLDGKSEKSLFLILKHRAKDFVNLTSKQLPVQFKSSCLNPLKFIEHKNQLRAALTLVTDKRCLAPSNDLSDPKIIFLPDYC